MRSTLLGLITLLLSGTAVAGEASPADSQTTQILIAEIRQLRQDLYTTAATIQRVQIAMYRQQTQAALLSRATDRFEQARTACEGTKQQRKYHEIQIEQAVARERNAQDSAQKSAAGTALAQVRAFDEQLASQEQNCQAEQTEAEAQLRLEQAKMNELQDQLDKLDRFLARTDGK